MPAIRVGTGVDTFTRQLAEALNTLQIPTTIDWLPLRAEYLPWSVAVRRPPSGTKIVHINTWLHPRFLPSGLPVVATMHLCVHDSLLDPYKSAAQAIYHRRWVRWLESKVLERAVKTVAVSEYTAKQTQSVFALPPEKLTVIPNGVRVDLGDTPARTLPTHRPFRLLYVGNWSTRKGVDLLAPIMRGLGAGFELWYTADARGAHASAALPPQCECVGRKAASEMPALYGAADALLFPSRMEGLPLAVCEAMAAGLPVIASDRASLPEVVSHGRNGFICQADNIGAYVSAIRDLAGDNRRYQAFSVAAHRAARDRFSVETMARQYADLYRDILRR